MILARIIGSISCQISMAGTHKAPQALIFFLIPLFQNLPLKVPPPPRRKGELILWQIIFFFMTAMFSHYRRSNVTIKS